MLHGRIGLGKGEAGRTDAGILVKRETKESIFIFS
jgi:hypothetical protein